MYIACFYHYAVDWTCCELVKLLKQAERNRGTPMNKKKCLKRISTVEYMYKNI